MPKRVEPKPVPNHQKPLTQRIGDIYENKSHFYIGYSSEDETSYHFVRKIANPGKLIEFLIANYEKSKKDPDRVNNWVDFSYLVNKGSWKVEPKKKISAVRRCIDQVIEKIDKSTTHELKVIRIPTPIGEQPRNRYKFTEI